WELEADLSILWLPTLGNVELGHDLEAGDDRAPVGARDLLVLQARAVDPYSDHGVALGAIRLDVDVGGPRTVGVHDHLIGEADDRAVVFVQLRVGSLVAGRGDVLAFEVTENR